MEVLYHIRPYFVGIFPYIGLNIGLKKMVGTSNKSVPEMASDCCLSIFSVVSLT